MSKQALSPQYLPAIDRQLEYRAGLLPAAVPTLEGNKARKWLGDDFTCTVAQRPCDEPVTKH